MDERQAVGQEAAAHDQHALVAQRRQPPADLEQVLRIEVGHRHLEDRDVGVRVHRLERHPRAVVEAAVSAARAPARSSGIRRAHLRGELGRARRVVGHPVVVLGEAVEVVDQRAPAAWR